MNLFWSENLAVGHPMIDAQHRTLFDRFAGLLAASDQGRGADHLQELFCYLDEYVTLHFREEEALMARNDYPEIGSHQTEHRIFCAKLSRLKAELATNGPTVQVLIHTNKALIYWLTEHIRDVDTKLTAFLQREENSKTSPIQPRAGG